MHAEFWHQKWESNEIGFHEKNVNPLLEAYFSHLNLVKSSRIFIPLCGKTRDIAWLLNQGFEVVGAELSELAIKQLFNELNLIPKVTVFDHIVHYQGPHIDIFVSDIFKLTPKVIGQVDGVYDRAALVALPLELRAKYTAHVMALSQHSPQLLICFEYDQTSMQGPPFCVSQQEVKQHYALDYQLSLLHDEPLAEGLKGRTPANQLVWLLT